LLHQGGLALNGVKRLLERLELREKVTVIRESNVGSGWGVSRVLDAGLRRVLCCCFHDPLV
jgi:hypothetical protein